MIKKDSNYTASSFFIQLDIKNQPDEISDAVLNTYVLDKYRGKIKAR